MSLFEDINLLSKLIEEDHKLPALQLCRNISVDLSLDTLYPDQVPYRDTLGRLKFAPIEQSNECTNLCSCCKVIE